MSFRLSLPSPPNSVPVPDDEDEELLLGSYLLSSSEEHENVNAMANETLATSNNLTQFIIHSIGEI
ncbi:MAG: hypothetical protein LBB36_01380 [Fibromonadaceae bacterium]|nr:hypothetical protein [Fibromonadaceae bacterium]